MRGKLLITIFILIGHFVNGQVSLIPNGGFEQYSQLPSNTWQWHYCLDWHNASRYFSNTASPDYFHIDGGGYAQLPDCQLAHVSPHSGKAVMGFISVGFGFTISNYREYLANKLTEPLIPGVRYKLSFWLCNGDKNWIYEYKSNNIGVHFSLYPMWQNGYAPMNLVPQYNITQVVWNTKWTEYTYTFVADTTQQYIIIGNFYPDSLTTYTNTPADTNSLLQPNTYYFIDDVVLEQLDRLQVEGNSTICQGDSVSLRAKNSNHDYFWIETDKPDSIIHQGAYFIAQPNTTTSYTVYAGIDTTSFIVHVTPNPFFQNELGNSIVLCQDEEYILNTSFPNASYLWQDGSTQPSYIVSDSGWYYVQISNHCGVGVDSIFIGERECFLHIPSAFTPNNDGHNDVFKPIGIDAEEIKKFRIYNRWGQEVYVGDDLLNGGWNGRFKGVLQAQDSYIYIISYLRERESTPTSVKGIVTLLN